MVRVMFLGGQARRCSKVLGPNAPQFWGSPLLKTWGRSLLKKLIIISNLWNCVLPDNSPTRFIMPNLIAVGDKPRDAFVH